MFNVAFTKCVEGKAACLLSYLRMRVSAGCPFFEGVHWPCHSWVIWTLATQLRWVMAAFLICFLFAGYHLLFRYLTNSVALARLLPEMPL